MDRAPTRIVLVLAAAGLLGLLAAQTGSGEPPAKQEERGSKQPGPVSQTTAIADAKQPNTTLFKNAKVFDGKSDKLTASTSVLVLAAVWPISSTRRERRQRGRDVGRNHAAPRDVTRPVLG
jgi:hypothetical protein